MQPDAQRNIDENIRRTVGYAALRKVQQLLATWEHEERRDRRIALLFAGVLVCAVLAVAAYYFSSLQLVPIN